MDQLDVASRRLRQRFKIFTVDRDDLVSVHCEQHDTGIDDVCKPGGTEELSSRPTERLIEGADIDSAERLRQTRLTCAPAPHLCEDPGVGQWDVSVDLSGLETDPHRAFVALQRDQRA